MWCRRGKGTDPSRALLESPGNREAAHNLQSIVQDIENEQPNPPPPNRPRQSAAQDETTGFRNRLPKRPEGGKDL